MAYINGKEVLFSSSVSGVETGASVPVFNLSGIGLPPIPSDESTVSVEADTSAIRAALGNGAVKFVFVFDSILNSTMECLVTNVKVGSYFCTSVAKIERARMLFNFIVSDDSITANVTYLDRELPSVDAYDDGKTLRVVNGAWTAAEAEKSLPAVSATDNGKILRVVNGAWTAASLATYSGETEVIE